MTRATDSTLTEAHPGKPDIASRRRGGTWRIIRIEAKRGSALVMFVAVAGAGLLMLFADAGHWTGRWYALAADWRTHVSVMAPVAAAIGAWQGSRDQRRRTLELVGSTSKDPVRWAMVAWLVPAGAAGLGSLLVWVAGAGVVAPIATYGGTDWVWTVVGGVIGVTAFATIGAALGSLSRSILVTAVIGFAALLAPLLLGHVRWRWGPATVWLDQAEYVTLAATVAQTAWLYGLATLSVVVVAGRLRPSPFRQSLIVATVLALGGFVGLIIQAEPTRVDDHALTLTCAGSAPEFCVAQDSAFLLDSAGPIVAEEAANWEKFDDMPEHVVNVAPTQATWPPPPGVHQIRLGTLIAADGGLADDARRDIATQMSYAITEMSTEHCPEEVTPDASSTAHNVANAWGHYWVDPDSAEQHLYGRDVDEFRRLTARPDDDQVNWVNRYRDAVISCDNEALATLGRELGS